jgi:hypothetical protein
VTGSAAHERERISGVGLAFLLMRLQEWVHRRVDRVSFIDVANVHWHVSLDFTYPGDALPVKRMIKETPDELFVPLALMDKHQGLFCDFSLRNEFGDTLPVLTRTQNRQVATDCLTALARTVILDKAADKRSAPELPTEIATAFKLIVASEPRDAQAILAVMRAQAKKSAGSTSKDQEVIGRWATIQTPAPQDPGTNVRQTIRGIERHGECLWKLLSADPLNWLAGTLATQFILLTPYTDVEAASRTRRVMKFSYDHALHEPAGVTLKTVRNAALQTLGWRAKDYIFVTAAVARAASYHLEIPSPPLLQIVRAQLAAARSRPAPEPTPSQFDEYRARDPAPIPRALAAIWHSLRTGEPKEFPAPITRAIHAAVQVTRRPRTPELIIEEKVWCESGPSDSSISLQLDAVPGSDGSAEVSFQPCRVGLMRFAALLATGTTVMLFILKGRLAEIAGKETAPALLLILPTLIAALLARPGEHAIATRLLLGIRVLIGVSGLASFVAVAALAAWAGHTRYVIWTVVAWASLGSAILLNISLALNWRRAPKRRSAVQTSYYTYRHDEET